MWGHLDFLKVISITLSFQTKQNSNSKNFADVGFCGLKLLTVLRFCSWYGLYLIASKGNLN